MLIQDENRLKTWVSHVVEDLSDAEPDALAKYVIALVKKPLSDGDLEKLCSEKLSVFLQSHTDLFVSKLFSTLQSGQYLIQTFPTAEQKMRQLKEEEEENEPENKIAAETDELVLTDAESEPEAEERDKPPLFRAKEPDVTQSPKLGGGRTVERSSSGKVESSGRPTKEDSRKIVPDAQLAPPMAARRGPSPAPLQPKPPRKRISPPRSNSTERRPERGGGGGGGGGRSPATRRRVILGPGPGALRVQPNRHYREARLRVRSRSKSRSRSPHVISSSSSRKEKRPPAEAESRDIRNSRRHRCRDFHEKGYCMRGDSCPYDHGPDPVVVEDSALEKIVRGTVYDPSNSYGVNPPPPGLESSVTSSAKSIVGGPVPEGYNPEAPALTTPSVTSIDFSVPPPPLPQLVQRTALPAIIYPPGTAPPAGMLPAAFSSGPTGGGGLVQIRPAPIGGHHHQQDTLASMAFAGNTATGGIYGTGPTGAQQPNAQQMGTTTFGGGGGGMGNGNGMMMRGGRFKPYQMGANRNQAFRSLLVRKIPSELNKIASLDQHFGKFGQITNIQVQYEGRFDSALVTFKTRREAVMAFKSTEPIFNNRFIKVYWQNDSQAHTAESAEGNGGGEMEMGAGPQGPGHHGPTIPLAGGEQQQHNYKQKPPPTFPRSFTKTFGQQQQPNNNQQLVPEEATRQNIQLFSSVEGGKKTTAADSKEQPQKQPSTESAVPSAAGNNNDGDSVSGPTAAMPLIQQQQQLQRQRLPSTGGGGYNNSSSANKMATALAANKRMAEAKEALGKMMELHRMKTDLYGKLVEQQKTLLQKLQGTEEKTPQRMKLKDLLAKTEGPAKMAKAELEELSTRIGELRQKMQKWGRKRSRTGTSVTMAEQQQQKVESPPKRKKSVISGVEESPRQNTPDKKLIKLCRMVYVSKCPQELNEKLIVHMEKYGDLFDYDINAEPRVFTYKDPMDAQKAVVDAAGSFEHATIKLEWAPVAKGVNVGKNVVPDGQRKPSEQVTPRDLLKSLDYDEEEEEEERTKEEGNDDEEETETVEN